MADTSLTARLFGPLRSERLWIVLVWSLALAVGLAGWDWAERAFEEAASGQQIVLLPRETLDAGAREAERAKLSNEPGVLSAQWVRPSDLAGRVSQLFPQSEWQEMFPPEEESWLPWALELRPIAPLERIGPIRDFVSSLAQDGNWRMALWDPSPLVALAQRRTALRVFLGFWLALIALGGVAALLRIPSPRKGRGALLAWSALLGALGPAAVWSAALLGGGDPDGRTLAVAAGGGFVLATLVAPMLRLSQGPKKISLTLGEDSDERVR